MSEPNAVRNDVGFDEDDDVTDFDDLSHEGVQSMADETVYETGVSFAEHDKPDERLTEMPAWLQTFAASVVEAGDPPAADPAPSSEPVSSPAPAAAQLTPDPSLPDWLRADGAAPGGTAMPGARQGDDFADFQDFGTEGADSFISEDDLPDWLKAFSTETAGDPLVPAGGMASAGSVSTMPQRSAALRVPPVENIWLSAYDRQALGPGRTLFALLASNTATTVEDGGMEQFEEERVLRQPDSAELGAESSKLVTADASASTATAEGDSSRNSLRTLLLAAFVVVLLVIVAYAVLS